MPSSRQIDASVTLELITKNGADMRGTA